MVVFPCSNRKVYRSTVVTNEKYVSLYRSNYYFKVTGYLVLTFYPLFSKDVVARIFRLYRH